MESGFLKPYSGPWTHTQLSHLLRRTLFGVTQPDYHFFKDKSLSECVDILLSPIAPPEPPAWILNDHEGPLGTSYVFAPEAKDSADGNILGLRAWWVGYMLSPQRSITEKMVLFWHNHFSIELLKVLDSRYAYLYLCLLRNYALGDFKKLTREITTTPCMLVYLNGNINEKAAPNENFGRELQELFTVGKGIDSNYTEDDVKAAARVLSGWKEDPINICSYFDPDYHNTEDKKFSAFYNNHKIKGRKGLDGAKETDDLIDMICAEKEVARFICRKLYRWFVNTLIDESTEKNIIPALADILIKNEYEVKPVLKAMLTSAFFYDDGLMGGMFKNPVDYLIGLLRVFNINFEEDNLMQRLEHLYGVAVIMGEMGQYIGEPPSVAGWPAYYEFPIYDKNWVTSENLSFRNKIARLLSYPEESEGHVKFDFLSFAKGLSDPGDPKSFVVDSWDSLCCTPLGENRLNYMATLLEAAIKKQYSWSKLWGQYTSTNNEEIREEALSRMRKVFDFIFNSAEFQIM